MAVARPLAVALVLAVAATVLAQTRPAPLPVPKAADEVDRARAADPDYFARLDADGLTVLHLAAQRGDAAVVERMLALGADADVRGRAGLTPLHAAMSGAYTDMNNRGMAPPDQRQGWTQAKARERERQTRGRPDPVRGPMQFAEVTRLLLAKGADASAVAEGGLTPLHVAAMTGNVDLVAPLIAAKADVNAVFRPRGLVAETPLVAATGRADLDTVRALLDAGADPAKVPEESRGYFANRAMSDVAVFRLLLDRGLELPPGALKLAARHGPDVVAEVVRREKGAGRDAALYEAVGGSRDPMTPEEEDRQARTVQALLDAGASPSGPGGTGKALAAAVARQRARVVKLLRDRGGKIDWARLQAADESGEFHPFKIAYGAAFEDNLDRLRAFEALGMPLDPLGAAMLGRTDRLRAAIKADPRLVRGEAGSTPLYFAAAYGHVECVRALLDAGTDPNAQVPSWDTPDIGPRPLDGAAERGQVGVVRLLLDRGADPKRVKLSDDEWAKVSPEIRTLLGRDAPPPRGRLPDR